jgi:hypothetical protein
MTSNDDDDDDDDLTVHDDDRPTDALETECLGHYATLDTYLRAAVDTLVLPEGQWLLDCLDLVRVRDCLESGGLYRLRVRAGRVFRDRLPCGPG